MEVEMIPFGESQFDKILVMMQQFYAIDNYPFDNEKSRELLRAFAANENLGHGWLISENDRIVGYVILTYVFSFEYGGTIGFLDELYIDETARGKGFAKYAIAFVKLFAEARKLKIVYLEVEPHNSAGQKLYLASGFTAHKRTLMRYQTPI